MLYVVATPIGNLKDITLRAIEVLKEVDVIAAEDTRHTRKLLSHYDIHTPLVSYHDHNAISKSKKLVAEMQLGKKMALVSDAGTPCISDPGYRLVKACHDEGVDVKVVPGACAAIAALSVSGLPSDQFVFKGFLPFKSTARQRLFKEIQGQKGTFLFYESPHRLEKSLTDMSEVYGNKAFVSLHREITKTYDTQLRGTPEALLAHYGTTKPKGEYVVLLTFLP